MADRLTFLLVGLLLGLVVGGGIAARFRVELEGLRDAAGAKDAEVVGLRATVERLEGRLAAAEKRAAAAEASAAARRAATPPTPEERAEAARAEAELASKKRALLELLTGEGGAAQDRAGVENLIEGPSAR